jgi:hypothetical protein
VALRELNYDGSVDVEMYGNRVIVTNEPGGERTCHMAKSETLNVPISRLTVNGHEFPYQMEQDLLTMDVRVPASASTEIGVDYGDGAR